MNPRLLQIALTLCFSIAAVLPASAACLVNGVNEGVAPTCTNLGGCCGKSVSRTGTDSCTVRVTTDQTGSSATDCLTLANGVTVEIESGSAFVCPTNTDCGIAVEITGSGSGNSQVKLVGDLSTGARGYIEGCWSKGVLGAGSYTTVENVGLDLRPVSPDTACQTSVGIDYVKNIKDVVVSSADIGIDPGDLSVVDGAIIKESRIGILGSGTAKNLVIERCDKAMRIEFNDKLSCNGACVVRDDSSACICAGLADTCVGHAIGDCATPSGSNGIVMVPDADNGVTSDVIDR